MKPKIKIIMLFGIIIIASLFWLQYDHKGIVITHEKGINKSILVFQLKTHGLYKKLDCFFDVGTLIIPAVDTTYYYQIKDTMWYLMPDTASIMEGGGE